MEQNGDDNLRGNGRVMRRSLTWLEIPGRAEPFTVSSGATWVHVRLSRSLELDEERIEINKRGGLDVWDRCISRTAYS